MRVRAISLWQPWASAMALGIKCIETRDWVSRYRGPLLIHAAQKKSRENREVFNELLDEEAVSAAFLAAELGEYDALPFGAVLAVVRMVDCVRITKLNIATLSETERVLGDYRPGREAWITHNARRLVKPFPCAGRQGFFWVNVPDGLWPPAAAGSCRMCGCTETTACVDARGRACHWVKPGLCSACE